MEVPAKRDRQPGARRRPQAHPRQTVLGRASCCGLVVFSSQYSSEEQRLNLAGQTAAETNGLPGLDYLPGRVRSGCSLGQILWSTLFLIQKKGYPTKEKVHLIYVSVPKQPQVLMSILHPHTFVVSLRTCMYTIPRHLALPPILKSKQRNTRCLRQNEKYQWSMVPRPRPPPCLCTWDSWAVNPSLAYSS